MSNFFASVQHGTNEIVGYFRGVVEEVKKVRWPTRKELVSYTITVVIVCTVMFVLTYGFDLLVTRGFELLGIGNS
ncbi:preprotein translocase subunit SecE [Sulfoacidibacillus thermotolerans]|uniref:preprotein translocase subunit SecE n=1 Tax=Sulfoacidibacillus thermotolerans TaxID=1765684 RepID=UPI0015E812C9|nr:preprotein translocase subunit SecE [Sulfoacidibacillus thermotolerans]